MKKRPRIWYTAFQTRVPIATYRDVQNKTFSAKAMVRLDGINIQLKKLPLQNAQIGG